MLSSRGEASTKTVQERLRMTSKQGQASPAHLIVSGAPAPQSSPQGTPQSSAQSASSSPQSGVLMSAAPVYEIDHLVLGCADLPSGLRHLEERLGQALPLGGKHLQMGTHNALMRLGPRQYFELIAINPDAPTPPHARWFGLDEPDIRAQLLDGLVPLNWVLRCPNLREALDDLPLAAQEEQGGNMVCSLWRDHLQWDMALAPMGRPALEGGLPSLICWADGLEPWRAMPDLGWRLGCLRLPQGLERLQASLGQPDIVCGQAGEGLAFGLEKDGQQLWFERHTHLA